MRYVYDHRLSISGKLQLQLYYLHGATNKLCIQHMSKQGKIYTTRERLRLVSKYTTL